MSDILGEVVPDMRTEIGERAKAMHFTVVKRRSLSMRVSDDERREREGLYSCSSVPVSLGLDASSRVECPRNINRLQNMCYCVSGLTFPNCGYYFDFPKEISVFYEI